MERASLIRASYNHRNTDIFSGIDTGIMGAFVSCSMPPWWISLFCYCLVFLCPHHRLLCLVMFFSFGFPMSPAWISLCVYVSRLHHGFPCVFVYCVFSYAPIMNLCVFNMFFCLLFFCPDHRFLCFLLCFFSYAPIVDFLVFVFVFWGDRKYVQTQDAPYKIQILAWEIDRQCNKNIACTK